MSFNEINVDELYKRDEKLKKNEVMRLLHWTKTQPHLPGISELQTALFLHSCYYKQEAAKSVIDIFFTVRTLCPDLFRLRSFKDPAVKFLADFSLKVAFPKKTPNGELVIFSKIPINPDHFIVSKEVKMFDAILMINLHQNGPSEGLQIVIDLEDVVLAHLIKFSASVLTLKKFLYLLQEGLPVRLKYIHFINIVPFMDKIIAIIKPFLKKELIDALIIHSKIETVYEYISKDVLPLEYGGSSDAMPILLEKFKTNIEENEKLLDFQDSQIVVESKRPGTPKNINSIFGVEGSFKLLEVD